MPEYDVVFEVPAVARVNVRVTGDNQQDALANGFGSVQDVTEASATIAKLSLELAENISINQVSNAVLLERPSEPNTQKGSGNLEKQGEFSLFLEFNEEPNCNKPPFFVGGLADAEACLEPFKNPLNRYGFAVLRDIHGVLVRTLRTERGGWELERVADSGEREIVSWLPNEKAASDLLLAYCARFPEDMLCIYDFTNRDVGPVLHLKVHNE